MSKLSDWITIYENAIPEVFCDECMNLFNIPSIVKGSYSEYWRRYQEFPSIDQTPLWDTLKEIIKTNYEKYKKERGSSVLNFSNTIEAPNMLRYVVNPETPNIFNLHADNWNIPTATRQVSIILYLNDVNEGGCTFFPDLNIRIRPKKGQILFFPSFFNYMHMGEAPLSNSKYIIVSWVHFDGQGHAYRVHKI